MSTAKTNERAALLLGGVVTTGLLLSVALPDPGKVKRYRLPPTEDAVVEEEEAPRATVSGGLGLGAAEAAPDPDPAPAPPPVVTEAPTPDPGPAPAAGATGSGRVAGRVTWKGDRPAALPDLTMAPEKMVGCDHHGPTDATNRKLELSADGGVANVVVFLAHESKLAPPVSEEPFLMDQLSCRFEPHVAVVPLGGKVRYMNSDPTNHNVKIRSRFQPDNKMVAPDRYLDYTYTQAENFTVGCDIHPWMTSVVHVSKDFFGVTDADGNLDVGDLPAGEYKVSWWHEQLGKGKEGSLTVTDGGTTELAFEVSEGSGGGRRR